MYINWRYKELTITIALYGPPSSGKTTTWRVLARGAITLPEEGSDTFSLRLDDIRDKHVVLQVRDIPGKLEDEARRRTALYGVDGLIFVADSDAAQEEANRRSIEELQANLERMNKSIYTMPFLLQYNKRDLPTALEVEQLQDHLNPDRVFPYQETSANVEEGVLEVLRQATDLILATALQ